MKYIFLTVAVVASHFALSQISLTGERQKTNLSVPYTEYSFDVQVNGIPTRKMQVARFIPIDSVKGTILLSSGGSGKSYYFATYGDQAKKMIDTFYNLGYEIYDFKYVDDNGWEEHCEGIGSYHKAVQIYSEMVRFLHKDYFVNKDLVFATGNSGGSFQIGFGLTNFGLDSILDMVILTGGPPISDLRIGIFGDNSDSAKWPFIQGGLRRTDYLMGWTTERHSERRDAPDSILDAIDSVSLVSPTSHRNYSYSTFVNFVQSDDPSNAHHQAKIYYNAIQSSKAWHSIDSVKIHSVPSSVGGATKIIELILNYKGQDPASSQPFARTNFKAYPNPFVDCIYFTGNAISYAYITDLTGNMMNTYLDSSNKYLQTEGLTPGFYFLHVITSNSEYVVKIYKKS